MAPVKGHYDYLLIGGGSAGVASARRAAKYGAKALVIEGTNRLGGTCVNVGCVPKKVMWQASDIATKLRHAKEYGFLGVDPELSYQFDWAGFKAKRDAYVKRLNGIYAHNLEKEGVDYVFGWAQFKDSRTVEVKLIETGETVEYTADKIVIAAGGTPTIPKEIPGHEFGITSDGFFELEQQPKKVAIVGAGYIAVELAGVFNSLGTETHLLIRGDTVLRAFDSMIQERVTEAYEKHGVHLHKQVKTDAKSGTRLDKLENGQVQLTYASADGSVQKLVVDQVLWTIGRRPLTETLNLETVGVATDDKGKVIVDAWQNTNVPNIYSLGDIAHKNVELTPVAIAAGRKLSNRLFGPAQFKDQKQDFENIPSVVFSHPEAGTVGLSEKEAVEKFGKDKVKVYQSTFVSMYFAPFENAEDKEKTSFKIVVTNDAQEKVLGLHLYGDQSAEILQGFGAAIRMGATKADFDNVVAIHPTAAEEIVTMT